METPISWQGLAEQQVEALVVRYRKERITLSLVEVRLAIGGRTVDVPFADFQLFPIFRIPCCLAWREHVYHAIARDGLEVAGLDKALVLGDGRGFTLGSR